MKKNVINIIITVLVIFVLTGCNDSDGSDHNAAYRPNVYVNGFPVLSIDLVETNLNWNASNAHHLQNLRDNWLRANLNISNTSDDYLLEDVEIFVRGRGNSTWLNFGPKRPIRFRFPDEHQAIFDSPHVGRDWVTFANAADPSNLRNFAAFYLAHSLGSFNFVPQTWFIHLYLDGEYRGVYLVLDEREAGPGRGDLYLHEDPTISEFMLEFDARTWRYPDEPVNTHWVDVSGGWDIRWPSTSAWMSEPNNPHAMYVDLFLDRIDIAMRIADETTIRAMVDLDSLVDFYLIQELTKNQDARWSSLFFQIRGQGAERRLYAGPVWDFDLSAGTTYFTESPIGSIAVERTTHYRFDWWYYLYHMSWFRALAYERWQEIRDIEVRAMLDRIEYMADRFADDFDRNNERWWPGQNRYLGSDWNSATSTRHIHGQVAQTEFLLDWYEQRIIWMDEWLSQ